MSHAASYTNPLNHFAYDKPLRQIGFSGGKHQQNTVHQGRVRTFPHVEGNYAAHVYIPGEEIIGANKLLISQLLRAASPKHSRRLGFSSCKVFLTWAICVDLLEADVPIETFFFCCHTDFCTSQQIMKVRPDQ
jgi:hypothetical protein